MWSIGKRLTAVAAVVNAINAYSLTGDCLAQHNAVTGVSETGESRRENGGSSHVTSVVTSVTTCIRVETDLFVKHTQYVHIYINYGKRC